MAFDVLTFLSKQGLFVKKYGLTAVNKLLPKRFS